MRKLSRVAEPPRDLQDTVHSWVPACFHDDASDAPTASHQDLGKEEESRSGARVVVHSSSWAFNSLVFKYGSQARLEVFFLARSWPAQPQDPTMVGGQEAKASQSAKASLMMLRALTLVVRRQAAPLKSLATKSTFSSNMDSNFLPIPRFLA